MISIGSSHDEIVAHKTAVLASNRDDYAECVQNMQQVGRQVWSRYRVNQASEDGHVVVSTAADA